MFIIGLVCLFLGGVFIGFLLQPLMSGKPTRTATGEIACTNPACRNSATYAVQGRLFCTPCEWAYWWGQGKVSGKGIGA